MLTFYGIFVLHKARVYHGAFGYYSGLDYYYHFTIIITMHLITKVRFRIFIINVHFWLLITACILVFMSSCHFGLSDPKDTIFY